MRNVTKICHGLDPIDVGVSEEYVGPFIDDQSVRFLLCPRRPVDYLIDKRGFLSSCNEIHHPDKPSTKLQTKLRKDTSTMQLTSNLKLAFLATTTLVSALPAPYSSNIADELFKRANPAPVSCGRKLHLLTRRRVLQCRIGSD